MPNITNQQTNGTTKRVSTGNVFDDALPVADMPETGYKFLIFGLSGTGKTTLACSFPKPLLLIRPEEVEDGSRSVRTVAGVSVTPPIIDPDQLVQICDGQRSTKRYKSLVLDGGLRFQDLVVKKHMGLQDVPVQQTWGMVPQADWNRIGIMFKDYLRELMRLANIGTHIIVVCGERSYGGKEDTESDISVPKVLAAFSPSIGNYVHEVCDYNVHAFKRLGYRKVTRERDGEKITVDQPTGKTEYCLHIDGPESNRYGTKFRKPREVTLPDVLVLPPEQNGFELLDALIQGKVTTPKPQQKVVVK